MTKAQKFTKIIEEYRAKCGTFSVSHDKDEGNSYIYTERFTAEPLSTDKTQFEDFSSKIKSLFGVTFADHIVMEKFATGSVKTVEGFETIVKTQSLRWCNKYPFAAFMVIDNENDAVVGYEVIGNGSKNNTGETAYLFNKDYHRNEKYKYVGYENVGALILGYGAELYKNQAAVNQTYNEEIEKLINGSPFNTVSATSRIDNPGSVGVLEKLGFNKVEITHKFGHDRHELELNYDDVFADVELQGATDTVL